MDFPYLYRIRVANIRTKKNFVIDLPPRNNDKFRNLVITGKNGSGKTTLLEAIRNDLNSLVVLQPTRSEKLQNDIAQLKSRHETLKTLADSERRLSVEMQINNLKISIDSLKNSVYVDLENQNEIIRQFLKSTDPKPIYCYIPAERSTETSPVSGPTKLGPRNYTKDIESRNAAEFLQFLVNRRTEQAYAREDGDITVADDIEKWFENVREILRKVMEDDDLELRFDRSNYNFIFTLHDKREVDLTTLAHGHSSVIAIIAEILLRSESFKESNPGIEPFGIVIIDEIETHLHLELQRMILPVLTELFPRIQFLVATHSPAVISSISNALIYDLTYDYTPDDTLIGMPYGTLVTSYFGVESEYSDRITNLLKEVIELTKKRDISSDDHARMTKMIQYLEKLSINIGLDLRNILEK